MSLFKIAFVENEQYPKPIKIGEGYLRTCTFISCDRCKIYNPHLTGKTIIGSAHGTQEIVHVIIVNTPTRAIWCLAMEGFISGVVLRLCDRLREVLLINFWLDKLVINSNRIIANLVKTWTVHFKHRSSPP